MLIDKLKRKTLKKKRIVMLKNSQLLKNGSKKKWKRRQLLQNNEGLKKQPQQMPYKSELKERLQPRKSASKKKPKDWGSSILKLLSTPKK